MNAQQLINRIQKTCDHHGVDPRKVEINYRHSNNSDVYMVKHVWEDLYDAESNSILTSISLVTFGGETR
jgi:hypothetical protein